MHYLSVKSMACSYNLDQIPSLLINNGINLLLMPNALIEYFFHIQLHLHSKNYASFLVSSLPFF
jgi:hypothetical protein